MSVQVDGHRHAPKHVRSGVWEFRLVFAATFVVMLVPAVFSRLTWSHWGADASRGSIFHDASTRADKVMPFMFMG